MNRWKIAAVLGILILIPLAATGCTPSKLNKPKCLGSAMFAPTPAPECSLLPTPARTVVSDGLYTVGQDMPPGTWESNGVPSDNKSCVWFTTPDPSKDPDTQNLPSFQTVTGHRVKIVLEPGMGFFTKECGWWTLRLGSPSPDRPLPSPLPPPQ